MFSFHLEFKLKRNCFLKIKTKIIKKNQKQKQNVSGKIPLEDSQLENSQMEYYY